MTVWCFGLRWPRPGSGAPGPGETTEASAGQATSETGRTAAGTENPVVELLLWEDTGELPTRELMATAPPLHTDSEVPTALREGPPRIRPNLFGVLTAKKASAFNPDIGEVIATGIPRPPAGDYRDGSVMTGHDILSGVEWKWFGVFMDQPRYEAMRELTRAHTRPRRKRWTDLVNEGGLS